MEGYGEMRSNLAERTNSKREKKKEKGRGERGKFCGHKEKVYEI